MRRPLCVVTCLVVVALSTSLVVARSWTDQAGRKTEAEFVRVFDGNVVLQKGNQVLKVPFGSLSSDDQAFVRKELKRKGQENLLPPAPAEAGAAGAGPKDTAGDASPSADGSKIADPPQNAVPAVGKSRVWTDAQGRKVIAEFGNWDADPGSAVTMRKGTVPLSVPFAKFSAADQEYLRKLVGDKAVAGSPTAANPIAANRFAANANPSVSLPPNPGRIAVNPPRFAAPPTNWPPAAARFVPPQAPQTVASLPPARNFQTAPPPQHIIPTPAAEIAPAPTPPPVITMTSEEFTCGKCGHRFGAVAPPLGSKCPQCGCTFGELHHANGTVEHFNGVSSDSWAKIIGGVISLIAVGVGAAYRASRSS